MKMGTGKNAGLLLSAISLDDVKKSELTTIEIGICFLFQTFFSQIVKQQVENAPGGTMPRTPATARRVQLAQCSSNANVAQSITRYCTNQTSILRVLSLPSQGFSRLISW